MFSIVIPLFDKATHIKKAIQSVLNQTFSQFELIIVNDGSKDNGPDIVNSFSDNRIQLHNQANSGVSIARNNGVKAAKFDYIAFLDADDWWAPGYLEAMKGLINSLPEAGIYAAKYAVVKNGRIKEARIDLPKGFKAGYINYFAAYAHTIWMPLSSSSAILPKIVFQEQNGFKANLKFGEDFELWARIALKYPVAFLNQVLVYYNQDVNISFRGISHKKFHDPQNHYIYNLKQFYQAEQEHPDLKVLLDRLRGQALLKYYLHGVNSDETHQILRMVDLNNLSSSLRRQYQYPRSVVRNYWVMKRKGSFIKQWIIRTFFRS